MTHLPGEIPERNPWHVLTGICEKKMSRRGLVDFRIENSEQGSESYGTNMLPNFFFLVLAFYGWILHYNLAGIRSFTNQIFISLLPHLDFQKQEPVGDISSPIHLQTSKPERAIRLEALISDLKRFITRLKANCLRWLFLVLYHSLNILSLSLSRNHLSKR